MENFCRKASVGIEKKEEEKKLVRTKFQKNIKNTKMSQSLKRLQYRAFGRLVQQRIGELSMLINECMDALEEPEEVVEEPGPVDLLLDLLECLTPPATPENQPEPELPPVLSSAVSPVVEEEGDIVISYNTPLFYGDNEDEETRTLGSEDTYSVVTDPELPNDYDLTDPFIDDSQQQLEE